MSAPKLPRIAEIRLREPHPGERVGEATVPYARLRADRPAAAAAYAATLVEHEGREVMMAIGLTATHHVMAHWLVSAGTLGSTSVSPREVYAPALAIGASAVVVVHNHPSGDVEPSADDIAVTSRLRDAGKLLGIPLLDHVIAGHDQWTSLRARGHIAP